MKKDLAQKAVKLAERLNKKNQEQFEAEEKINREQYLPIDKILKHKKTINIVVTATGTRKTTYFAKWAKEQAIQGKVIIWIRRRKENIANTAVDMFREEFSEEFPNDPPYITSRGVKLGLAHGLSVPAKTYIYFVPLSLYYQYKGLTKIADKLAGIIYDEAIPMEREAWIGNDTIKEGEAFTKFINIGARNKTIPIFFLCNPNVLGSWLIQKWFPDYRPDPKKEKMAISKIDEEAFIYSMPWMAGDRGTIELLESKKEKEVTKLGIFHQEEYKNITDQKPKNYLCTLIINKRELELGKKDQNFILTLPGKKRRKRKVIVFRRSSLIANPGSTLGDKKCYSDWLASLWSMDRLLFADATIKDFLKDNIDRESFW